MRARFDEASSAPTSRFGLLGTGAEAAADASERPSVRELVLLPAGRALPLVPGPLTSGLTDAEIGTELRLSPNTVKEHASAMFRKLAARNRADAVRRAQGPRRPGLTAPRTRNPTVWSQLGGLETLRGDHHSGKDPPLPTPFVFRTVACVAILAFAAGCLAAVANAQEASAPQRTLVATGTGTVKVTPKDRTSNASIVAAMDAAEEKALPAALKDARAEAAELAAAAGVTLGPIVSYANSIGGGFYFGSYQTGSFGPGKFCGNIRTRSSRIGKDGKRHVGKFHTRRVCRFPSTLQRSVQLTFALA
ncbi:MAG TPA: LuxR C-terminal-related transcriptional regulator [Baekduia sp.]|nr:LuxR C-terminal-related transcriptional regulator [Baekduia sp.]